LVVRSYWKGYLKLALVSCLIALHAACSTAEHSGRLTRPVSPAIGCNIQFGGWVIGW
jgi:hypothetical protein